MLIDVLSLFRTPCHIAETQCDWKKDNFLLRPELLWSTSMLTLNDPSMFFVPDFRHSWSRTTNIFCNVAWWFTCVQKFTRFCCIWPPSFWSHDSCQSVLQQLSKVWSLPFNCQLTVRTNLMLVLIWGMKIYRVIPSFCFPQNLVIPYFFTPTGLLPTPPYLIVFFRFIYFFTHFIFLCFLKSENKISRQNRKTKRTSMFLWNVFFFFHLLGVVWDPTLLGSINLHVPEVQIRVHFKEYNSCPPCQGAGPPPRTSGNVHHREIIWHGMLFLVLSENTTSKQSSSYCNN